MGEESKTKELVDAASKGDLNTVKSLVQSGVDVNKLTKDGWEEKSALSEAVRNDHLNIVEYLLGRGADIEVAAYRGPTPLLVACGPETPVNLKMVEMLLDSEANIYAQSDRLTGCSGFVSPLTAAVFSRNTELMALLLRRGASIDFSGFGQHMTALHHAAHLGYVDVANFLLSNGSTFSRTTYGETELHRAIECTEMMDLLVQKGAEIDAISQVYGTALAKACSEGFMDSVKFLVERGANIYLRSNSTHGICRPTSPLACALRRPESASGIADYLLSQNYDVHHREESHGVGNVPEIVWASKIRELPLVKTLIERGARVNDTDDNGNDALVVCSDIDTLKVLLSQRGIKINHQNKAGVTALMNPPYPRATSISLLLSNGADPTLVAKDGSTAIHSLAQQHDYGAIEPLHKVGGLLDAVDMRGNTPLMHTFKADRYDERFSATASTLLEAGCDPDIQNDDGEFALLRMTRKYYYDVVPPLIQVLLSHGVNVNLQDAEGTTSLMEASDLELVKLLVSHGADVNLANKSGQTAIMQAKSDEVVKVLVDSGADVNHQDKQGRCALVHQLRSNYETMKVLLRGKADPNIPYRYEMKYDDDTMIYSGTVLIDAIYHDDLDTIKVLVGHDADVLLAAPHSLLTPLMSACVNGSEDIVAFLLNSGASKSIDATDKDGKDALHYAVQGGKSQVVKLLLHYGAKVERTGCDCHLFSSGYNSKDVLQMLLGAGCDVNAVDANGFTVLDNAVSNYGSLEVISFLLDQGAEVEGTEKSRPLLTVYYPEILLLLLQRGANPNRVHVDTDKNGKIYQHTALQAVRDVALCNLLLDWGADVNFQSQSASALHTALSQAVEMEDEPLVRLLLSRGADISIEDESGRDAVSKAKLSTTPDGRKIASLLERYTEVTRALELVGMNQYEALFWENEIHLLSDCEDLSDSDLQDLEMNDAEHRAELMARLKLAFGAANKKEEIYEILRLPHHHTEVGQILLELGKEDCTKVFYDQGIRGLNDCKTLKDGMLKSTLGMSALKSRKQLKKRFSAGPVTTGRIWWRPKPFVQAKPAKTVTSGLLTPIRRSLSKRLSQRKQNHGKTAPISSENVTLKVEPLRRNTVHAFLTHDWGETPHFGNHKVVMRVNGELKRTGLATWFDEDRLSGNIAQQIASGMEACGVVVVFVTHRYMEKLCKKDGVDYCRDEFTSAIRLGKKLVAVVMEERMLDTGRWRGPLGLHLGNNLHIDFSTPEKRKQNLRTLIKRIETEHSA